jgi:hypothetical protein
MCKLCCRHVHRPTKQAAAHLQAGKSGFHHCFKKLSQCTLCMLNHSSEDFGHYNGGRRNMQEKGSLDKEGRRLHLRQYRTAMLTVLNVVLF